MFRDGNGCAVASVRQYPETVSVTVDWYALRRELKTLRESVERKKATFARAAGIDRQTVSRVEDVDKDADYTPTLDTLAKWLTQTNRTSMSAFIAQFETGKTQSPTSVVSQPVTDEVEHRTASSQRGDDVLPRTADVPIVRLTLEVPQLTVTEARLLQRLGTVLIGVGDAAEFQAEDQQSPRDAAKRRATDHQDH